MGGFRDTLAPIIRLICMISYAAYTFLGLILMIVGLYYNFAVEGSNSFVTVTACFGGFFMLLVGALGIFASLKENAVFMAICLLVDTLLFIFLLAACITGMFIAFDIQDPVSEGVQLAYCDDPAQTTHVFCNEKFGTYPTEASDAGKATRSLAWTTVVQMFGNGAPGSCEEFNDAALRLMVETPREVCGFVDCDDTTDADENDCVGVHDLTAADCACLEEIPFIESAAAVDEECKPRPNATDGVACSLTPAQPPHCAIPAPEANTSVIAITDPDYYSAQDPAGGRSENCVTPGFCSNPESCEYVEAKDATLLVNAEPAREQACPTGCVRVAPVSPQAEVVEACTVVGSDSMHQEAYCRNCEITDLEGDNPDCYRDDSLVTTDDCSDPPTETDGVLTCSNACVPVQPFDCYVTFETEGTPSQLFFTDDNSQTGTRIWDNDDDSDLSTDWEGTAPATSSVADHHCQGVSDPADPAANREFGYMNYVCVYTPPRPAVEEVQADCLSSTGNTNGFMYGTAETPAKRSVVGEENEACTGDECKTLPNFMGDCDKVKEVFTTVEGVPSDIYAKCHQCWDHWQYTKISEIKGNLWPATITIFALFLFIVILTCINIYLVDIEVDEEDGWKPEGIMKILSLVFNGIVLLFGLIVIIVGAYMYSELSSGECPENADCTNWSVIGIIIVGLAVFGTAAVSIVAVAVLGGIIGRTMLRVTNVVFLLTALLTLICGIAIAIIAGALDESNKQFEENFETVRAQYEQKDPNVCKVGGREMEAAECKNAIRRKVSAANTGVVIVLTIICFSFLGVAFFTLEAFYIFKAKGDDDDDDDDDDDN